VELVPSSNVKKGVAVAGKTNLDELLTTICPELSPTEYVFCTVIGNYGDFAELSPIASFTETEGLTLLLTKQVAIANDFSFDSVFRKITLTVHSSLDAVGLTAAVSQKLADHQISANVIAAYYHDHIFVQAHKADLALTALKEFSN